MYPCGKYGYHDDAHYYCKEDIDKVTNEFFGIGPYFGKYRKGFTAALVFKFLVREAHGLLKAICKYFGSKLLYNDGHEIVLETFGYPAHHGHRDGGQ